MTPVVIQKKQNPDPDSIGKVQPIKPARMPITPVPVIVGAKARRYNAERSIKVRISPSLCAAQSASIRWVYFAAQSNCCQMRICFNVPLTGRDASHGFDQIVQWGAFVDVVYVDEPDNAFFVDEEQGTFRYTVASKDAILFGHFTMRVEVR